MWSAERRVSKRGLPSAADSTRACWGGSLGRVTQVVELISPRRHRGGQIRSGKGQDTEGASARRGGKKRRGEDGGEGRRVGWRKGKNGQESAKGRGRVGEERTGNKGETKGENKGEEEGDQDKGWKAKSGKEEGARGERRGLANQFLYWDGLASPGRLLRPKRRRCPDSRRRLFRCSSTRRLRSWPAGPGPCPHRRTYCGAWLASAVARGSSRASSGGKTWEAMARTHRGGGMTGTGPKPPEEAPALHPETDPGGSRWNPNSCSGSGVGNETEFAAVCTSPSQRVR